MNGPTTKDALAVTNRVTGETIAMPRLAQQILVEGWRDRSYKGKRYETQQAADNAAISSMCEAGFTPTMIADAFEQHSTLKDGISDWIRLRPIKAAQAINRQYASAQQRPDDSSYIYWQKKSDLALIRFFHAALPGRNGSSKRTVLMAHAITQHKAGRPTYHLSARAGAALTGLSAKSFCKNTNILVDEGHLKLVEESTGPEAAVYAIDHEGIEDLCPDSRILRQSSTLSSLGESECGRYAASIREALLDNETGAFDHKAAGLTAGHLRAWIAVEGDTSIKEMADVTGKCYQAVYRGAKKLDNIGFIKPDKASQPVTQPSGAAQLLSTPPVETSRWRRGVRFVLNAAVSVWQWAVGNGHTERRQQRLARYQAERKAFRARLIYWYGRMNVCDWFKKTLIRRIS